MRAIVRLAGQAWVSDLKSPIDCAHVVTFDDDAPVNAFGLPAARREPVAGDGFVGDVGAGGSVNCPVLHLAPHGNGTHTEGVGHLLADQRPVTSLFAAGLLSCALITVEPRVLVGEIDGVRGRRADTDRVITRGVIEEALYLLGLDLKELDAVFVRTGTEPGDFSRTNPPYFTEDAAAFVGAAGAHLLTDLPSLDREEDGGGLFSHRAFFGLDDGATALVGPVPERTITELCRAPAPEEAPDGAYVLALHLAPLAADAAPSRPLLFALAPAELVETEEID